MRIDYLTVTVFGMPDEHISQLWDEFTGGRLGKLVPGKFGGRGFRLISWGLSGSRVYTLPITTSKRGNYFSIELPGKACSCLLPSDFQVLHALSFGGIDIRITRIDYAFDGVPFTPLQFLQACGSDAVITVASRKSISWHDSPYQLREDGKEGCQTAYLGSKESERRVRVYNLHGFTRLEYQLRGEWAEKMGMILLGSQYKSWVSVSMSHLLDFVRFTSVDWWDTFAGGHVMSQLRVYSARLVSLERIEKWITRQVVPALFAFQAVRGLEEAWEHISSVIYHNPGRLDKYQAIMQLAGS